MEKIYANTNKIGTVMSYQKFSSQLSAKTLAENIGTCAAPSTIWIKNMFTTRPELSAPSQSQSAVMFAKNWIRKQGMERIYANISDAGLRMIDDGNEYDSLSYTFQMDALTNGYSLMEIGNAHFIARGCSKG